MPYFTYCQRRLFYREQGQGPLLVILPGNTPPRPALGGSWPILGRVITPWHWIWWARDSRSAWTYGRTIGGFRLRGPRLPLWTTCL
jgi:hypothetical protein